MGVANKLDIYKLLDSNMHPYMEESDFKISIFNHISNEYNVRINENLYMDYQRSFIKTILK